MPFASGNFFHSSIVKDIGPFDERIKYSPDGEYWYRIALKYSVIKTNRKLAIYHQTGSNYMWETWGKKDFISQTSLLATIINDYDQSLSTNRKKLNINIATNQTMLTILFRSFVEKKRKNLFLKYLPIFMIYNMNPKKWHSLCIAIKKLLVFINR